MSNYRRLLLLGLATLALAGCAGGPHLSRIADPDVDFHSYRTYTFLRADGDPSLIDRRLLAAARTQMELRGYALDDLAPDLLVNVAAVVEQRQGLRAAHGDFPALGGAEIEDYRLGRLAVDLVDARRQQVFWHGSAEGRVTAAMLRDAGTAVEKAVAAVFEGFPIRAGARAAATAPRAN